MKVGMTAVQLRNGGKVIAIVAGSDSVEHIWAANGAWVPIIGAISRGEGISYFARASGLSDDQPRSLTLKSKKSIDGIKRQIEQLGLKSIPVDPDRTKIFSGEVLVKELPKTKKPTPKKPQGLSVGSENQQAERKDPSGLPFDAMRELESLVRSHNTKARSDKRPAWSIATKPMIVKVYKRALQASNAGVDGKGNEVSRHKKAMMRVNSFVKLLFFGHPENTKYVADADCLPEMHPWRRTVEAKRDITSN